MRYQLEGYAVGYVMHTSGCDTIQCSTASEFGRDLQYLITFQFLMDHIEIMYSELSYTKSVSDQDFILEVKAR